LSQRLALRSQKLKTIKLKILGASNIAVVSRGI
jgi:hypothetical protein